MPEPEVVIVDLKGVEHVFPAGFDPKKAAAIVKAQAAPVATASPTESLVEHIGVRPAGGYTVSDYAAPSPLNQMLMSVAHPQTVGDMLPLLQVTGAGLATAGGLKAARTVAQSETRSSDVVRGVIAGFKSYLTKRAPVTSDIVKAIKEEASARIIAQIDRPGNVQRAFAAVKEAAANRGVTLSPDDILEVLKDLNKTDDSIRLPLYEATRVPSGAVTKATNRGAVSYGPHGNRGEWIQRRIAETK